MKVNPASGSTQDIDRGGAPWILRCAGVRMCESTDADSLWIEGDRISSVGRWTEMRARASGVRVVDASDGIATPGFVDAHVHWSEWAMTLGQVDLGTPTLEEALERLSRARPDASGWIRGQGWDAHLWGRRPTAAELDRVVPDHPAALDSRDIHSAWLNTAAMRRCGIGAGSPDPEGGVILRDPHSGEPTGVLLERAREIVLRHLPEPSEDSMLQALDEAQAALHARGITGVHDVEPAGYARTLFVRREGRLRLRVLQHLPPSGIAEAGRLGLSSGVGDAWVRVGGVKVFVDGSLGSRTAWMRDPYTGTSDDRGIQVLSETDFRAIASNASATGLSMTVHAIGDAAVELAIRVLADTRPGDIPHRIEHVQLCPPDLIEPFVRAGLIASMQPFHIPGDIDAADRHWGPRSAHAYPIGSLLRAGAVLAFGSDAPVVDPDPLPALRAAVRRQREDGTPADGWYPKEHIRGEEAVAAYTAGPARAAREDDRRGWLKPGYDADITVWSADPARPHVPGLRALLTVVAGEVVHDSR